MSKSVSARAHEIATFRHLSVWLMETVARWTPITAQMEAKVMFGRHIWDYAQMADALGKRTYELRRPEHFTLAPHGDYAQVMQEVAAAPSAAARVAALYDGILPGLIARYRAYVAATDPILDEPTVVIVERILRDLERHRAEAAVLQREMGWSAGAEHIAARERAVAQWLAEAEAA